jgi:hypothetical protein
MVFVGRSRCPFLRPTRQSTCGILKVNAARKEMAVQRGEQVLRIVVAVAVICAAVAFAGWGVARGAAEGVKEEEPVGRYQVAVPDLVLDTMTGRLMSGRGQVLESPTDPSGTEVGRYSVDGYVTAVTRYVGLDVINQPVANTDLVKGYVVADTKTGQIVRQRIYYSQPLQRGDL